MTALQKSRENKDTKQSDSTILLDVNSIWSAVILLTSYGLIMIYSASGIQYIASEVHGYDSMYLLKRQLFFVIAGFVICLLCQFINYSILYKFAKLIYFLGIVSIALLRTSLGVSAKGATRWLSIGGIQFQVAELIKISVIIILAYMVQHYSKYLSKLRLLFRMWFVGVGAAILLMEISNDLSSSLVVLGITFGITFIYTRTEKIHLSIIGTIGIGVGIYLWNLKSNLPSVDELANMSFRVGRIAAWLDPGRYASNQGYQTLQALYAIGSGGLFGKGLGNSIQKISAIPEAQNDMIFSIICEELGLIGAAMLIFLIAYLGYKLYEVAINAKNLFGSALVTGVLIHIMLQSFINIGVNVNLIPNTGIGLPFISYGGTAVFCQLFEIAIVLSVGRMAQGFKMIDINRLLKKGRRDGFKKRKRTSISKKAIRKP